MDLLNAAIPVAITEMVQHGRQTVIIMKNLMKIVNHEKVIGDFRNNKARKSFERRINTC